MRPNRSVSIASGSSYRNPASAMHADQLSIARTMRWSCEDPLLELVELALQLREHLRAAEDASPSPCACSRPSFAKSPRVDRRRERRAGVVAPQRAVVGAPVGRRRAPARSRSFGSVCGVAAAPQRADPVAELLQELLVAEPAGCRSRAARWANGSTGT